MSDRDIKSSSRYPSNFEKNVSQPQLVVKDLAPKQCTLQTLQSDRPFLSSHKVPLDLSFAGSILLG